MIFDGGRADSPLVRKSSVQSYKYIFVAGNSSYIILKVHGAHKEGSIIVSHNACTFKNGYRILQLDYLSIQLFDVSRICLNPCESAIQLYEFVQLSGGYAHLNISTRYSGANVTFRTHARLTLNNVQSKPDKLEKNLEVDIMVLRCNHPKTKYKFACRFTQVLRTAHTCFHIQSSSLQVFYFPLHFSGPSQWNHYLGTIKLDCRCIYTHFDVKQFLSDRNFVDVDKITGMVAWRRAIYSATSNSSDSIPYVK